LQINEQQQQREKLRQRHVVLNNKISDIKGVQEVTGSNPEIPVDTTGFGSGIGTKNKGERYKVRSQHALFQCEEMPEYMANSVAEENAKKKKIEEARKMRNLRTKE